MRITIQFDEQGQTTQELDKAIRLIIRTESDGSFYGCKK